VVIRNVKVTGLRGTGVGIHTTLIDRVLVENCEVADNAGHTKGIVLRNARNLVVRGCELRRNSSTALDFYTVTNSVVQDCRVIENPGMHANGLTFYVGCRGILVERNEVRDGNVALTVQDGENMIIRNNILEGGPGGAPAIGLWDGKPYNNIVITNNLLRYHPAAQNSWSAAIYGGNPNAQGYAIVNNIVDGLSGNVFRKADLHHNIFTMLGPGLAPERLGNNLLAPDLKTVCVNPDKGDYRLKPGSPAIGAGVRLTSINAYDRYGVARHDRREGGYRAVRVRSGRRRGGGQATARRPRNLCVHSRRVHHRPAARLRDDLPDALQEAGRRRDKDLKGVDRTGRAAER